MTVQLQWLIRFLQAKVLKQAAVAQGELEATIALYAPVFDTIDIIFP